MPNRSVGYGHKCRECAYCSRTTRPGCHSGWCERPGQVNGKEEISPSDPACNVFHFK